MQEEWDNLCDIMIDLIRQQPEHARTYYERLPKAEGGPGYSQERKEKVITSLMGDGRVVMVMLEKPKNRSNHYLRVDEEVMASAIKGQYSI